MEPQNWDRKSERKSPGSNQNQTVALSRKQFRTGRVEISKKIKNQDWVAGLQLKTSTRKKNFKSSKTNVSRK